MEVRVKQGSKKTPTKQKNTQKKKTTTKQIYKYLGAKILGQLESQIKMNKGIYKCVEVFCLLSQFGGLSS